jgi:hypothetical protein
VVVQKGEPDLNKMGSSGILEVCETEPRNETDEPRECILPQFELSGKRPAWTWKHHRP